MSSYIQTDYLYDKIPRRYRNVIYYTSNGYYVGNKHIADLSASKDEIRSSYQRYLLDIEVNALKKKINSQYGVASSQLDSAQKFYQHEISNSKLSSIDYSSRLDNISCPLDSLTQIRNQIKDQLCETINKEIKRNQSIKNSVDKEIDKLDKIYSSFSKKTNPSIKELRNFLSQINHINTSFFKRNDFQSEEPVKLIDSFNSLCLTANEALSNNPNQLFDENDMLILRENMEKTLSECSPDLNGLKDAADKIQGNYSSMIEIVKERLKRNEQEMSREELVKLEQELFTVSESVRENGKRVYKSVGMQDLSSQAATTKDNIEKLLNSFTPSDLNEEYVDDYQKNVENYALQFNSVVYWDEIECKNLNNLYENLMNLKEKNSALTIQKKIFDSLVQQIKKCANLANKTFEAPKMSLLNFEEQKDYLIEQLSVMKKLAIQATFRETIEQVNQYFKDNDFVELETELTAHSFENGLSSYRKVFVDKRNPFILRIVTIYSNGDVDSETRPAVLEHNGKFYYLPLDENLLKQLNGSCDRAKNNKLKNHEGTIEEDHKTVKDVFYYRISAAGTQDILDLYSTDQNTLDRIKQRETTIIDSGVSSAIVNTPKREMLHKAVDPRGDNR